MTKAKSVFIFFFFVLILISQPSFCDQMDFKPKWEELTFNYTADQLDFLKHLPKPEKEITEENLDKLHHEVSYILKSPNMTELDRTQIPAYVAVAQKDFAWLSFLISGQFKGNLGPVTLWILQLFHPDITLSSVHESDFDVYTSSIAALVIKKASERWDSEKRQIKNYAIKQGEKYWKPTSPGYVGLDSGSAKTWFLTSSKEFLAEAPPQNEEYWKEQCLKIIQDNKNLDNQKIQRIFEWAGMTSPDAGSWGAILNNYFKEHKVPFDKQLLVRSILQPALADANAAAFHSKYTYWIKRPSQVNPSIKPLIVIPNHPSYPSAHSTIGSTAAVVLSELFPEDSDTWNQLANEAGMSRIWAGIHYPLDHQAGLKLGKQVGEAVMQRVSK